MLCTRMRITCRILSSIQCAYVRELYIVNARKIKSWLKCITFAFTGDHRQCQHQRSQSAGGS